jgi:hypothetical protein
MKGPPEATMRRFRTLLASAAALAALPAFAATADVKFVDPDNFADLAAERVDEADTMRTLAAHLQRLAAKLPADQVLHVEVLDVDRAGSWRQTPRGRIRVMTNRADPPKFHLRYTLESRGQVIRSGDERLTDLDYTNHVFTGRTSTPLYFEKRLLSEWFDRTFGAQLQASAR